MKIWDKWVSDYREKKLEREKKKLILGKLDFREKKERVQWDFKNFEDKFVFWLYKRLKC